MEGHPSDERLYSIGEVVDFCQITHRALRYYEDRGLIQPDYVGENNYRYYKHDTMLRIPVVQYLKMMNFELNDIRDILQGRNYEDIISSFQSQIKTAREKLTEVEERLRIIQDWKQLIQEAEIVVKASLTHHVNVKVLPRMEYLSMPYTFDHDYGKAIINLEFTKFVEEKKNVITGAVTMFLPSIQDRLDYEDSQTSFPVLMVQDAVRPIPAEHKYTRCAGLYLTCYHVGDQAKLRETYEKMLRFAEQNGYELAGPCLERYVTDQWTTPDASLYVTEILMPIECLERT